MAAATLSVAVCQMTSIDDVARNLEQVMSRLARLEADVPELVCFPENSLFMRVREGTPVDGLELSHPAIRTVADWARRFAAHVHLGSVPLKREGRVYNSSLFISRDGAVADNYQKIHLFDVDVEGQKPVRESDTFAHGVAPAIFEVGGWKIGSTICYDLRFAELFLEYAREGVDAILVPSAFLVPTGQAHWHVLLRARAIECQAYVLAAAQGGTHNGVNGGARSTFGHSMIVDPWGVVLAESGDEILRVTLSRERIERVRAQIPVAKHRRLD